MAKQEADNPDKFKLIHYLLSIFHIFYLQRKLKICSSNFHYCYCSLIFCKHRNKMSENYNTFYTFIPRNLSILPTPENRNIAKFQVDNLRTAAGSKFSIHLEFDLANFQGIKLERRSHQASNVVGTFIYNYVLNDYETVSNFTVRNISIFLSSICFLYFIITSITLLFFFLIVDN